MKWSTAILMFPVVVLASVGLFFLATVQGQVPKKAEPVAESATEIEADEATPGMAMPELPGMEKMKGGGSPVSSIPKSAGGIAPMQSMMKSYSGGNSKSSMMAPGMAAGSSYPGGSPGMGAMLRLEMAGRDF